MGQTYFMKAHTINKNPTPIGKKEERLIVCYIAIRKRNNSRQRRRVPGGFPDGESLGDLPAKRDKNRNVKQ